MGSSHLILVNGKIVTLNPQMPHATALVLRGDEIVHVGDDAGAASYRTHSSETIDLGGKLTLPAFTDAHIHFTGYATSLETVDLTGCRSVEQAVDRVRERVAMTPEGDLVWGGGWNNAEWSNSAFPDKRALDAVAPRNPVILTRKDGHSIWLNSAMLAKANITRETVAPPGGMIDLAADGEPSGILRENAMELLGGGIGAFGAEIGTKTLLRAIEKAHAAGITTIHNIEGANALRAFQQLGCDGKLTLRVVHSLPDSKLQLAHTLGIERGLGNEWLELRAVKIFADGSLGSRTAEMREPFLDTPGQRGVAVTNADEMLELARLACRSNLDVWIHAIGDYAITRALDGFEILRGEGYSQPIFRIEHVQHLHPSDVPRFRALNVVASVQPIHQPSDMRVADAALGTERARWTYAFRSLVDAEAVLAFGSDAPVEPLEPLYGIHAAVTRQNSQNEPPEGWYPEQRLAVLEAIRAFTLGAAESVGATARAGSLTVGKRGDVIVLDENILEIPPSAIRDVAVRYTISGGQIVHTA